MTDAAQRLVGRAIELIEMLGGSDVRELDVQDGEVRIRLRRRGLEPSLSDAIAEPDREPAAPEEPNVFVVRAPLVGTFYRAAHAGNPPLASEGTRVTDETVVGIVEALQIPTEIEAGTVGTVSAILAADGQAVEYGQGLLEISLDG